MNNGGIESIDALSKDSQSPPLPKPQIRMQHQFLIFVLWLCFLIRGVFYCSVLPLWDGFDEWAHFAVADYMSATRNALVDRDMRVSKEINLSLQLVPLPRGMTAIIPPGVRREVYWGLPAAERERRERAMRELPVEWARESAEGGMPAYEASQPPLYYWILAVILAPLRNVSLLDRVWLARIASFIIGSFVIPFGFFLCRKFFQSEETAIGVTALIVVMPELSINLARVSNESLSITLYTALMLAVSQWIEQPDYLYKSTMIGGLLGLGLLTKAYFITALPALCLLFLWLYQNQQRDRTSILRCATTTLIISLALAGWWYVRNILQTGTISGLDEALMTRGVGVAKKLNGVIHVRWINAIASILLSHIWYGGWSLLALHRWIYYLGFIFVLGGLLGLLKAHNTLREPKRFSLFSFYAWFWLGQAYQILMLFLSKSSSTAMGGWYLYSVVGAEVILGIMGIFVLVPIRLHATVLTFLIFCVAALDLYAVHFISIPYYAHANSFLDVHIAPLLINIPSLLTGNILIFLWIAFLGSTALTVITGTCILHRRRR